jgi:hypothetical protein
MNRERDVAIVTFGNELHATARVRVLASIREDIDQYVPEQAFVALRSVQWCVEGEVDCAGCASGRTQFITVMAPGFQDSISDP